MSRRVDVYVGRRLRQRRVAMGLTQAELAGKVGVRFQQIQKYETGANRISASRLWDVAEVLQAPVSYFFRGMELSGQPATSDVSDILGARETIELVRAYYLMPEKQRQKLRGLVQAMANSVGVGSASAPGHAA